MAGTKARRPSPEVIERRIKEGYGQGEGADFKPFLFVRDVPSEGASNMVNSAVTGRVHHYMSRQEFKVHLLAEYAPLTLDIREQFALLPWEETQAIARMLGIKHPRYPYTATPVVMTTDLLLTMRRPDGMEIIAVCVKLTKDLTPGVFEKLLIERIHWNRRGIRWILATEQNIPDVRTENLEFFENARNDERAKRTSIAPIEFSRKFEERHTPHLTFNEVMDKAVRDMEIDVYTGHALLGTAVWNRTSRIDIDSALIVHRAPVVLTV